MKAYTSLLRLSRFVFQGVPGVQGIKGDVGDPGPMVCVNCIFCLRQWGNRHFGTITRVLIVVSFRWYCYATNRWFATVGLAYT